MRLTSLRINSTVKTNKLRDRLNTFREETHNRQERLSRIFGDLNQMPDGVTCKAMNGLIAEARDTIKSDGSPVVKDAALITDMQRIAHYLIAGYGSLRAFADTLDFDRIAGWLEESVDSAADFDEELTDLAASGIFREGINERAMIA